MILTFKVLSVVSKLSFIYFIYFFFFLVVLRFELKAVKLAPRMPTVHFSLVMFGDGVLQTIFPS
jgi:hypothetical protein